MGIGESVYTTVGRTKINITLNGSLVYYFNVWVGDKVGQEAILGMYFMVPDGVRLDLAAGSLFLTRRSKDSLIWTEAYISIDNATDHNGL